MKYSIYVVNGVKSLVEKCNTLEKAQKRLIELENKYSSYKGYLFIEKEV